jgi:glycosyltransferase involved in cell wall biosynthesis
MAPARPDGLAQGTSTPRHVDSPSAGPSLEVCICTHDPRTDILQLTLGSLAGQSAGAGSFSVLIVDNASSPPLPEALLAPLVQAGIAARLVFEARPGVAQARLRAIRETTSDWILFVDDDNELAPEFIERGLSIAVDGPDLACFGGKLLLPSHLSPPDWARPFLPYLAIKDVGDEAIKGIAEHWGQWEPPTAGAFVRRSLALAYLDRITRDPRILELGRKGRRGLGSCEDSLMMRQALGLRLVNAYQPALRLFHHLDPTRFRLGYLLRLMHGYGRSHVLLERSLWSGGGSLPIPPGYRRLRPFLRLLWHEFRRCRRESVAFAVGMLAYHWSARSTYISLEGRHDA